MQVRVGRFNLLSEIWEGMLTVCLGTSLPEQPLFKFQDAFVEAQAMNRAVKHFQAGKHSGPSVGRSRGDEQPGARPGGRGFGPRKHSESLS